MVKLRIYLYDIKDVQLISVSLDKKYVFWFSDVSIISGCLQYIRHLIVHERRWGQVQISFYKDYTNSMTAFIFSKDFFNINSILYIL